VLNFTSALFTFIIFKTISSSSSPSSLSAAAAAAAVAAAAAAVAAEIVSSPGFRSDYDCGAYDCF